MIDTLKTLFVRDLNKLKTEIASYKDQHALWAIDKQIANSGGNLCLHLIGNLNTYIGLALGNIHYVRNRDLEFSAKDIPANELIDKIDQTITVVEESLNKVKQEDLLKEFPMKIWDKPATIEYTLLHLITHLNYHLGQVNYHRRLMDQ